MPGGRDERPRLGVVTRTCPSSGAAGASTLDLGQPVSAVLRPTYAPDGSVHTEFLFVPAPQFFSRTGYRVLVD